MLHYTLGERCGGGAASFLDGERLRVKIVRFWWFSLHTASSLLRGAGSIATTGLRISHSEIIRAAKLRHVSEPCIVASTSMMDSAP